MTTVHCVKAWEQGIWYHHLNGQGYGQNFLTGISRAHHSFHMGTDTFHVKCEKFNCIQEALSLFSAFEEGGTQETYHQLHNMPVPIASCHIL